MSKLGEVYVEILGDADPLAASVGDAFDGVEDEAKGLGSRVEAALGGSVAKGAAVVGAAAAGTLAAGVTQAVGLDAQLREVVTLLGETGAAAEQTVLDLQGPVRDLSTEVGIAQSEITDGLYSAISAGVPRDNAFEFLEVASKFAIGGVTDVETAVDGLTTAINAFGLDASDAESVSDAFFAAVQGGKTNAEELSASLFQVAPAANAAGLGLEETLAGVAALTASGTPTSVATTQMRAAINELADSGSNVGGIFEDVAGQSFRDFIAGGGSLEDALKMVGDAAGESGDVIGDYFGSVEAAAAATTLYNDDSGAFAANLELQADAAGAAAGAYGLVADGSQQQLEVLKQQGLALLTTLGQTFLPVVTSVVGTLVDVFSVFTNLPAPVQKFIGGLVALVAVLGPLPLIVGKMIGFFGPFAKGLSVVTTAFRILGTAILTNPLFLIGALIVGIIAAIWYFRDEIVAAVGAAWDWVRESTSAVWDWLVGLWDGLVDVVSGAWTAVVDWFTGLPEMISAALTPVWEAIVGFFTDVGVAISEWATSVVETVAGWVESLVVWVTDLRDRWVAMMVAIRDAVVAVVVELVTQVVTSVSGWVETVVGWVMALYDRWVAGVRMIRDAVIGVVMFLVEGFIAGVRLLVDTVIGLVTWLFDSWVTGVRVMRDLVVGIVSGLVRTVVDTISRWVSNLVGFVRDLRRDFVGTIRDLARDVLDRFRRLPGDVISTLGNLGSLLYESGREMIQGLINGAGSLLSSLGRFLLDKVPGWIRKPFEKALGISSPSRVFADYGRDLIDGLAHGIERESSVAVDAVEAMARDAAAAGTFDLPAVEVDTVGAVRGGSARPSALEAAAAAGRAAGGGTGGTQPMVGTINVYTVDPQRAGRDVLRSIRERVYLGSTIVPSQRP